MKKKLLITWTCIFLAVATGCGKEKKSYLPTFDGTNIEQPRTESSVATEGDALRETQEQYNAMLTQIADTQRELDEALAELSGAPKPDEEIFTGIDVPVLDITDAPDVPGEQDDPGVTELPDITAGAEGEISPSGRENERESVTVSITPPGNVTEAPVPTKTPTAALTKTPTKVPTTAPTTAAKQVYSITELNIIRYAIQPINVRNKPDTSGAIIGSIDANQAVRITGQCAETGWYRIKLSAGEGYISNKLVSESIATATPSPAATATPKPTATATPKPASTNTPVPTATAAAGPVRSELYNRAKALTEKNMSIYKEALKYVNEIRAQNGAAALKLDETLCIAATMRALEMKDASSNLERDEKGSKLQHDRPDGSSCFTAISDAGYDIVNKWLGENIAYGYNMTFTAQSVIEAWKNSPPHFSNLVNKNYTLMGIGCTEHDDGVIFWGQFFYTP